MKMKITKKDEVIVLTGRDKGRKGEVLRVFANEGRVLVAGVNMVKRHTRASVRGPGGIEEKEAPIHVSNVALLDPDTGKATRVGYKVLADGRKMRVARRSGEIIERSK